MDIQTKEPTNVWQTIKGKNSSKGKTILIKLGATPYEATQNYYPSSNYKEQTKEHTKERFRIPPPPTDLNMTKMCKSVYTNIHCAHGDKCSFAHTIEQLNPSKCAFGDDCRKTGDECRFIHPYETKTEYCERINVSPKIKEPRRILVPQKETKVVKEVKGEVVKEVKEVKEDEDLSLCYDAEEEEEEEVKEVEGEVVDDAESVSTIDESQVDTPLPVEKPKFLLEEVILKVPGELAVQAFTLAMKNGYKNIRVEIV